MSKLLFTVLMSLVLVPALLYSQDMAVDVDADMAEEMPGPPLAEQSVTIEFHSEFSPLQLFLRQGTSTREEVVTITDTVGTWTGMLTEGFWHGTVKSTAPAEERTFTIDVGTQPVEMRVFVRTNPESDVDVESGCACTTSNADGSVILFPLFLLALFTRRRWVSSAR